MPQNTNQLAHQLKMDYKTVKHHLDVLKKNKIVMCEGEYGATYFLSQTMEDNYALVDNILKIPKRRNNEIRSLLQSL
jgi:predicted ArsR family transcriptional regulator